MTVQTLDDNLDERQLLAVVAERVGTVKEAVSELKVEMKQDSAAIRDEMRSGFKDLETRLQRHEERLASLENDRAKAQGGLSFGRWIFPTLSAALGAAVGWVGKSQ